MSKELCEDCPPDGWPTDKTRCDACPKSGAESTPKPFKYSFDSESLRLAEHFLPDTARQAVLNELAQAIQDTVENFMCGRPLYSVQDAEALCAIAVAAATKPRA